MLEAGTLASSLAQQQIEQFFGAGTKEMPYISRWHDDVVATYCVGLLQGILLQTKADVIWSKGDRGLQDLGFISLLASTLSVVLGAERGLEAADSTFFARSKRGSLTPEESKIDAAGGADGMDAGAGTNLTEGGNLLRFLRFNVTLSELAGLNSRR